jgi:hypothetical protein
MHLRPRLLDSLTPSHPTMTQLRMIFAMMEWQRLTSLAGGWRTERPTGPEKEILRISTLTLLIAIPSAAAVLTGAPSLTFSLSSTPSFRIPGRCSLSCLLIARHRLLHCPARAVVPAVSHSLRIQPTAGAGSRGRASLHRVTPFPPYSAPWRRRSLRWTWGSNAPVSNRYCAALPRPSTGTSERSCGAMRH